MCVYACLASDTAAVNDVYNENEDTAAGSDGNDSEEDEARPAVKAWKRSYDRLSCCFYCKKILKRKMLRHLTNVHANEAEVAEALACKDKQRRILGIARLTNLGNFNHNCKVIEAGKGDLIVARESVQVMSLQDKIDVCLPCVYCCAFHTRNNLWRHVQNCRFKPSTDDIGTTDIVRQCRLLLQSSVKTKISSVDDVPDFKQEVLKSMRFDEVTRTVLNDEMILKYGRSLHQRLVQSKSRCYTISQCMRKLARLMLCINEITESRQCKLSLSECLSASYFDTVVKATSSLGSPSEAAENIKVFDNPTVALKLETALVKCAELKKGNGIRNGDKTAIKEADDFLSLHQSEWTSSVYTTSPAAVKQCKKNCLPEFSSASVTRATDSSASTVASSAASTMSAATPSPASTSTTTVISRSSSPPADSDTDCVPTDVNSHVECDITHGQKRRISVKQKWSDEELDSLRNAFRYHVLNRTQPGYAECQLAKTKYPCLYNRTLPQIKARFSHMQVTQTNSDTDCVPTDVNSAVECDITHGQKRTISVKRKWSGEELDSLRNAFESHMLSGTQPGYAECELAKNKYPCLNNRTLPQIKARFIHMQATPTS